MVIRPKSVAKSDTVPNFGLHAYIVGRKEMKIASHQKKSVAGSSSMHAISLHFLLVFVQAPMIT